jgi:hypothetical protein
MLIYDSNGQVGSANKTKLAFDATFTVADTNSSTATVSVVGGGGGGGGTNLLPPTFGTITGGGTIAANTNRVVAINGGDFETPITLTAPTTPTFDMSITSMTNDRSIYDCGTGNKFTWLDITTGQSESQSLLMFEGTSCHFTYATDPFGDGVNRWFITSFSSLARTAIVLM